MKGNRYGLWLYDVFIYLGQRRFVPCLFSCLTRIYNSIDFQFLFQWLSVFLALQSFVECSGRGVWPINCANCVCVCVCAPFSRASTKCAGCLTAIVIVAKYAAGGKV